MLLIRLVLIGQCCMICNHDTHNPFERKYMALTLTRKFKIHFHWYRYEILALVLCNDFMSISFFLFWTAYCSFKGPCDMKSSKIATAYDVWLSRYRPSNLVITTDFALVLVFINFLWAVYLKSIRLKAILVDIFFILLKHIWPAWLISQRLFYMRSCHIQ